MKRRTLIAMTLALTLVLPLPWATASGPADGGWERAEDAARRPASGEADGTLARSFSFTLHGDVVTAGAGLRGTGAGTLTISNIPAGARVQRALLYWATIGMNNTFTTATFSGGYVTGQLIGTSADTCWWDAAHNYTYRADVTSIVTGNGVYTIGGLPHGGPNTDDSQGAALVVVYSAPVPQRTIIVNDGAVTLRTNDYYTDTLSGFDPILQGPTRSARVAYLVGDGQAGIPDGQLSFRGTVLGTDVFVGSNGNYWDTLTYPVTNLVTTNTATTAINNRGVTNPDCLLWVGTVFSVASQYKSHLPIVRRSP
jgi:hypothetical protein